MNELDDQSHARRYHEAFSFSGSQHRAIQHTHAYGVYGAEAAMRMEEGYFRSEGITMASMAAGYFWSFSHAHSGSLSYMRASSVVANAKRHTWDPQADC